jgi:PAS domain S-box-containing protein
MSESVLLVEDNRALADNVAELLQEEHLDVAVCYDAESAEERARSSGFDLAIVDIRLAGMDVGLELVPKLQRLSVHGEVVLMTGNASLDTAVQAIRRGVYAYLIKPFEPEALISLAKRALAQVALKREKQALTQRLAASEALYRGVVESVESCILGLDAGGVIRFCNRFAAERFAIPYPELLGRPYTELCVAEHRHAAERTLAKALTGSPVRDYEYDIEQRGRTRRIRWTLTPLSVFSAANHLPPERSAPDPQLPVLLASGIDITDRLELERRSAEAEAMAAMGTLTTALAHEIRNPLNAAKLQLELLGRRARKLGDERLRDVLGEPVEVVRAEINRLASLLDEFLDLARPRQIERKSVALAELFEEVSKLEQPVLEHHQVALSTRIEPTDLSVRADRDKLKQVLINLIANAVDALRDVPDPRIDLHATRTRGGVQVGVTDNGAGIPAELAGSAFTPFVTSKPSGTGLGLAIVQKIARQHGGVAELVPLARGTSARLEIPD